MKFITAIAIVLLSSSTALAQTHNRYPACEHPDPLIRDLYKCRILQQNDANFQDYLTMSLRIKKLKNSKKQSFMWV